MSKSLSKVTPAHLADALVALTLQDGCATREALIQRGFRAADIDQHIAAARPLAETEMKARGLECAA